MLFRHSGAGALRPRLFYYQIRVSMQSKACKRNVQEKCKEIIANKALQALDGKSL